MDFILPVLEEPLKIWKRQVTGSKLFCREFSTRIGMKDWSGEKNGKPVVGYHIGARSKGSEGTQD